MGDVLPAITAFAVHVLPAVVAVFWAIFSTVLRVKYLMTITAKIFVLVVILLFLFMYSAEALCDGSGIKGFTRCSLIPVTIANLSLPVYLLSVGALVMWCLVAIVICGWAEFAEIRKRRDIQ
ncbi:hypothetical protein [Roseobacter sp.]|uniref:hypothetical protein n=1 Tax=Roseobacter sp. TaxID=1907202 RepID=UPI0029662780|nr:hypothetical protein [Roseobacter sp.]MDW3181351.1 hypothetical protein [Roseobacter sp.]